MKRRTFLGSVAAGLSLAVSPTKWFGGDAEIETIKSRIYQYNEVLEVGQVFRRGEVIAITGWKLVPKVLPTLLEASGITVQPGMVGWVQIDYEFTQKDNSCLVTKFDSQRLREMLSPVAADLSMGGVTLGLGNPG